MPDILDHRFLAPAMLALLCGGVTAALGQNPQPIIGGESEPIVNDDQSDDPWRFTFGAGYIHRFAADLDEGDGDVSADSISAGLNVERFVHRDLSLVFRLNIGYASYEFNGGTPSSFAMLDPWDSVHTIAFGGVANFVIDDQWSVFGGPVFQFAGESDADWGDSFTAGVLGGVSYAFEDNLVLGIGLGVVSQIEDSVRVFPFPLIEWGINDNLRLSSRGATGGRSNIELTGVELIWMPDNRQWEFALGGGYSFARFRLDDEGVAPDGVGQDESVPVWLRATFRPTPNINIDAVGGLGFGGEVSLDDDDGDSVARSEYDAAPFIGIFGSIRF